jgi:hypothetical protein
MIKHDGWLKTEKRCDEKIKNACIYVFVNKKEKRFAGMLINNYGWFYYCMNVLIQNGNQKLKDDLLRKMRMFLQE